MIRYNNQYDTNRQRLFPHAADDEWNDYKWQLANRITDLGTLGGLLGTDFAQTDMSFAITPHLLALVNTYTTDNPILRQVVPDDREKNICEHLELDPFSEQIKSPAHRLVKRYPDRVLVLTTNMCASYCRYCTRKWNWQEHYTINKKDIDSIAEYLQTQTHIREVILSGGEPMLLSEECLEYLLDKIFAVKTIENVRIASRALTFCPQLITPSKTHILKKHRPIWFITHFNHPDELSQAAEEKVCLLQEAYVSLANQSVLLNGINNDTQTMQTLLTRLESFRIKPYYLFQCDLVQGTNHFRCNVEEGTEILDNLRGNIGGLCLPTFVVDLPDGGKVPMQKDKIIEQSDSEIVFCNYEGKIKHYPRIKIEQQNGNI